MSYNKPNNQTSLSDVVIEDNNLTENKSPEFALDEFKNYETEKEEENDIVVKNQPIE